MIVSMRRRPRSTSLWRSASLGALVVFFASVLGGLVLAPASLLDRGDAIASIVACLVGVASLAVSAISSRMATRSSSRLDSDPDLALARAARRLAEVVRRQWQDEADARLVLSPHPLRVRWSSTGRDVSAPAEEIVGPLASVGRVLRLRLAGDVTEVADTFRQLPARQLVVLGAPGAGKSVLALLLTLDLLRDRTEDDAVPVMLSASSWSWGERLDAWLVRRLTEDYPALRDDPAVGAQGLRRLVESGRILPIIDGLDEIDARLHPAALREVRRFGASTRPFVLTSRSAEFQAAVESTGTPLARAAVVELEAVAYDQASGYLRAGQIDGERRWAPVVEAMAREPHGPLAQTFGTPLMVYLARTAYADPRRDPGELCDRDNFGTRELIERHLFDTYLPAVYDHPARVADASRPLWFVATYLTGAGIRDLAWWDLPSAVRGWRFVAAGYGAAAAAVACGLPVFLAAGARAGSVAMVTGAAVTALLIVSTVERGNRRLLRLPHVGWQRSIIRAVRYAIVIGLPNALFAGVLLAVVGSAHPVETALLIAGLYLGGAVGLAAARVRGQRPRSADPSTITPRSLLRNDRRSTIVTISLVTAASGLVVAVAAYPFHAAGETTSYAPVMGAIGFLVGSGNGVVISLLANPRSSWLSYLAARYYLAVRGHLPWRLMRFLDDAHERGVLRRAGAIYQFRHARLQEYLTGDRPAGAPQAVGGRPGHADQGRAATRRPSETGPGSRPSATPEHPVRG